MKLLVALGAFFKQERCRRNLVNKCCFSNGRKVDLGWEGLALPLYQESALCDSLAQDSC